VPSGRCHSLLAIPLLKKTGQEQALILLFPLLRQSLYQPLTRPLNY